MHHMCSLNAIGGAAPKSDDCHGGNDGNTHKRMYQGVAVSKRRVVKYKVLTSNTCAGTLLPSASFNNMFTKHNRHNFAKKHRQFHACLTCSRYSSSASRPADLAFPTGFTSPAFTTGLGPPAALGLLAFSFLDWCLGGAIHIELHRVEDAWQHSRRPLQQLKHAAPQLGLQPSTCLRQISSCT